MAKPRIVLIDFYTTGHHIHYFRDLLDGFQGLAMDYLIVAHPHFISSLPDSIPKMTISAEHIQRSTSLKRHWQAFLIYLRILYQIRKWHPTHIHFLFSDWHMPAIAMAWMLAHPKARPVLTVHWDDGVGMRPGQNIRKRILGSPKRFALLYLIRYAKAQVLVHHSVIAESLHSFGIGKEKISIIPYPVRPIKVLDEENKQQFREKKSVMGDNKLLLCFGATRFDKGADLAIQALKKLPDNYHLLIVGKPQYFQEQDLRQLAKEYKVENRLHLILRYIPDEEIPSIFNASDYIFLPYRKQFFGQSGPLTMAASIGKPIVSANLPILAATIHEFGLGLVFEPESVKDMVNALLRADQWQINSDNTKRFVVYHSPVNFSQLIYQNYLGVG